MNIDESRSNSGDKHMSRPSYGRMILEKFREQRLSQAQLSPLTRSVIGIAVIRIIAITQLLSVEGVNSRTIDCGEKCC